MNDKILVICDYESFAESNLALEWVVCIKTAKNPFFAHFLQINTLPASMLQGIKRYIHSNNKSLK